MATKLTINKEYYGQLLPFIENENITDITWNGRDLWIDHLTSGRYRVDIQLDKQWIHKFATRIANLAGAHFNYSEPLLEAETDELRISILHCDVANNEYSIAIRKTPAIRRLNEKKMLEDGYANTLLIQFLEWFVKSECSIIVMGDVGAGKTELIKYLTKFIPDYQRTITIEDNYELRLSSICPDLDVVEIKVDDRFTYNDAIKASLRQMCKWMLLSEARSREVANLLEAASTGCKVMTSIHGDDVRKLPDRILNMLGEDDKDKKNDIYSFFDVVILLGIEKKEAGIKRRIKQIGLLDRNNDTNTLKIFFDDQGFHKDALSEKFIKRFNEAHIPLKVGEPHEE